MAVNKERQDIRNYGICFINSETELTVSQLKTDAKNRIPFSDTLDIKEERLLTDGKVLENDSELVSPMVSLKYQIILN